MIRLDYQHMVQPMEMTCGQSSAHLLGSMSRCCSEDLQGRQQSCTGAATLATGNASPKNSEVAADFITAGVQAPHQAGVWQAAGSATGICPHLDRGAHHLHKPGQRPISDRICLLLFYKCKLDKPYAALLCMLPLCLLVLRFHTHPKGTRLMDAACIRQLCVLAECRVMCRCWVCRCHRQAYHSAVP